MDAPEETPIDRLQAGDEAAFEDLVGRYQGRLVRLARVYVRTESLAADVVQETWLAVLRGLPRFERRSSLRTWIFHILANRARTHAVRDARFVAAADLAGTDADGETADVDWFDTHGRWRHPPGAWAAVDPEGVLLTAEACNILDISETNQRVLLHRGRTRVRRTLADLAGRQTP